jgi:ParB family chromosome partitioning protein
MKLKIADISISNRIRQETGDLSQLKRSIQDVGLLMPIIVNEKNELLSGFRRLEACRELGWTEIEARVMNTEDDDVKKLDLEYHENLGRLDLTIEEQESYNHTRYDLLHPPKPIFSFWNWLKNIWEKIVLVFKRIQKK